MDRKLAHNLNNSERSDDVRLKEIAPFSQWLLKNPVKKGLHKAGYLLPTVIQASAIPAGKSGLDLLVQSKSGTGKTLIFCTVLLETCFDAPGLHSIIVTPTREIAIQIDSVLKQIGQYCKKYVVVNTIGGTDIANDRKELQSARTVVGTPGRLVHLIQSDILKTWDVKLVVLDEADQLFSPSHRKNVQTILNALPPRRQILACSATFCNKLDEELAKVMRNPLLISTKDRLTALLGIKQYIYELPDQATSLLEMEGKVDAMLNIFRRVAFKLCLIFAGSQSRAESYSSLLSNNGWQCELISGAQKQKQRSEIFRKFQNFETRIIVSTDLMARGIDSEHLNLVINVEPPKDVVTYLHRIGRAGRFGSNGIAITLVSKNKESSAFKQILEMVGCGMNFHEFPKTINGSEDENFWDPNTFKTVLQPEKNIESEESCEAILRSQENISTQLNNEPKTQIEISSVADSHASLDTKTFCIDSKDSAVNILPELVVENKENLLPLQAEDTPTSNRSSAQLSANTIDDASSIAADSVFSSLLEVNAPHPSLVLDPAKDLDYLSAELKEVKREQILKKDLFMDYCTNVLNDAEKSETEAESTADSLCTENEENRQRARLDDMFADYTKFICGETEYPEGNNQLPNQTNDVDEVSNEKDVSLQVCCSSLVVDSNDCIKEEQKTQNEVLSEEPLTDSQTCLQDTVCATNGSYSADSEQSLESKSKNDFEQNPYPQSEFYFDESLVQNDEVNTQVHLNNEADSVESTTDGNKSEITGESESIPDNCTEYNENISPLYDIWMKEYSRQVNFIESYVRYTLDYRKQCEDN